MFDIGFWELVLVFVLAVVVFGPERLPGLARKLGLFAARGRSMMRSLQTQLEEEIYREERKKERPAPAEPPPAAIEAKRESATADD
ncbi:MAG TPA: Sec-independent protein translocase protein TatB [Gammaproteobacteria bacterium]|nr:Sec-independent protein translocase protein TatB [Gammaproteobacteria bacterium]